MPAVNAVHSATRQTAPRAASKIASTMAVSPVKATAPSPGDVMRNSSARPGSPPCSARQVSTTSDPTAARPREGKSMKCSGKGSRVSITSP
ncbi:MAG: hypothetical protein Q9Q13_13160 [Acidobacteriota bacterium]|nr:hypothetical protein [Acidobacteriota bacterium]